MVGFPVTILGEAGQLAFTNGNVDFNSVRIEGSDATNQINAACDASIETYHLDHLFAVDYDPASKPGVSTALLNEVVESDGGVSRFTANALEQAPSGGSAPSAADVADAVWNEAQADHTTAGTFGEIASEVASILTDTGTTIPNQITGLNNLSAADVNTEVDTALADYDAPTKAELDAGFAALNDLSAARS